MFAYWHSVSVRALLAKAMGLPFCRSAVPRPTCEASTWIVWVVMGQSTWGWCHWWQLPWSTQKWCHRYGSNWSLNPSWAALSGGRSRWTDQGWRDLGMWLDLRTLEAQWCLWVLVMHVQHWLFQGLGGHHWHHIGIQRNWWLGPSRESSVGWTPSCICGQFTWDLVGGHHVLPQCGHVRWCCLWFPYILGTLQGSDPSFSGRCLGNRPNQREVTGNSIYQRDCWKQWAAWSPGWGRLTSIHGRHLI